MFQMHWIILLQMHKHKSDFNKQLLALRDKKMRVIEEVKQLIEQVRHIQSRLPSSEAINIPDEPQMSEEELPEKYDMPIIIL